MSLQACVMPMESEGNTNFKTRLSVELFSTVLILLFALLYR